MRSRVLLGISFITCLIWVSFTSAEYIDTGALAQNVNQCGILNPLNTTNAVYTLTQNVTSNTTCFILNAQNITFNGAGFAINYSANGTLGNAINMSGLANASTIRNLIFLEGVSTTGLKHGILLNSVSNITVLNVSARLVGTGSDALRITTSTNIFVQNSSINVLAESRAIQITTSTHVYISNVTSLHTQNAAAAISIRMSSAANHISLDGVRFQSQGPAIDLQGGSNYNNLTILHSNLSMLRAATSGVIAASGLTANITVENTTFNTASNDLFIAGTIRDANFSFTNVSRGNGESINVSWTTGANATVNYRWLLDVNVSNIANEAILEGANVTVANNAQEFQFSRLTDSSGRIGYMPLLEYVRNDSTGTGPSIRYFSNYTVNVTNNSFNSYSNSSINLTTNLLLHAKLTAAEVSDTTPPEESADSSENSGGGTLHLAPDILKKGYTRSYFEKAVIKFKVDDEQHSLTLSRVDTDSLEITVNSTPQKATLARGETKKFEVNGDNNYDLAVTFNNAFNKIANLTIKIINESIPMIETSNNSTVGEKSPEPETFSSNEKKLTSVFWIIAIIGASALVIAAIAKIRKHKHMRRHINNIRLNSHHHR